MVQVAEHVAQTAPRDPLSVRIPGSYTEALDSVCIQAAKALLSNTDTVGFRSRSVSRRIQFLGDCGLVEKASSVPHPFIDAIGTRIDVAPLVTCNLSRRFCTCTIDMI